MAWTDYFYDGQVSEPSWSKAAMRVARSTYGVLDIDDLKVSVASGDRTVAIAGGDCWGKGVYSIHSGSETRALSTVSSGIRYDLVVVRRNWSTNTTSIEVVSGSASRSIPTRTTGYGTVDDQPLALVKVTAGSTVISEIVDLRCWTGSGGGMVARDKLAMQYLNEVGTRLFVDKTDWIFAVDGTGNDVWFRDTPLGQIPVFGATPGLFGGAPVAGTEFLVQAGTVTRTTDASGFSRFSWPKPFPNGLLTVVLTNGDDYALDRRNVQFAVAGNTPLWGSPAYGNKAEVIYVMNGTDLSGNNWTRLKNLRHRVNYIAIGW